MNHEEAWAVCQRNLMKVSDEEFAQLRTLSDNDLTRIAQTADWFALLESNRRLSVALHREAVRTMWLTAGVFALTVALVGLTFQLAWSDYHRAASSPTAQAIQSEDGPG